MRLRVITLAISVIALAAMREAALGQSTSDNASQSSQGGEADSDNGPIHLHMPLPSEPKPAAPASGTAQTPAASAIHLHMPKQTQARVAKVKSAPGVQATIPFSLDGGTQPPSSPPAPIARAEPARPAPPAAPAPTRQVSIEAPRGSDHLTKRGAILFEKDAPAPSPAQYFGLRRLAGDLNSALETGASRIQLEAYGGAPGDKSSDARRLSLRRALAVRQLLIDDGVPSSRIDVRAMGGVDDTGPADRVDVFVRAG